MPRGRTSQCLRCIEYDTHFQCFNVIMTRILDATILEDVGYIFFIKDKFLSTLLQSQCITVSFCIIFEIAKDDLIECMFRSVALMHV